MAQSSVLRLRLPLALSLVALLGSTVTTLAEPVFGTPAPFSGMVRFAGPQGAPVYSGEEISADGRGFAPGQPITVLRGATRLSPEDLKADDKGGFSFTFPLPADAVTGLQPIVVQTAGPDSADVVDMQVSPKIPVSGAEKFDIVAEKVTRGLYQVVYSEKNGVLFVTSAVGRPPVKDSKLLKLDPKTLKVLAEVSPTEAPAQGDRPGGLFAVYGVAVDDANGTVWVGNSRQNTIAVYNQSDLSLVKQFPAGTVPHSRDIIVDAANGLVYAGTSVNNQIMIFDAKTLEQVDTITIDSKERGGKFGIMSLTFDPAAHTLYTVSMTSAELARINLKDKSVDVLPVPGSVRGSGIAYDPKADRIFVASQGSDNLIAIDGKTGDVVFDTPVGAGPLNALYDAATGTVLVMNRGSDTIASVDAATGKIVANLAVGSFPNHATVTQDGTIYAVNKSRGQDDAEGDQIWRIVPKK
ncbi:PQQ-binding-like beta-propeller repeat protein [Paenirhodobacter sp.]|uniref:Vgb family protein n=1 Tax=Paenirhodobacter sp. TaxID=1965326 RepID=UPI003B405645